MTFEMSRRGFLASAAAAGLALTPRGAFAAEELVAATFGGTWANVQKQILAPYFVKRTGASVVQSPMLATEQIAKLTAAKGNQPPFDVAMLDEGPALEAIDAGLIAKYDPAKSPNFAALNPKFQGAYGPAITMQAIGIAYNPKTVKTPPTSWADLWDPKLKGRVILPSLQNTEGVASVYAASALGTGSAFKGGAPDLDATFKKLAALKPNLLTVYTQQPQAFNLLEQGEAWMVGAAQASYTLLRKAAGAPIDMVAPKEGVFALPSGVAVIKGAPQSELAFAYVNEILGAELQEKLAAATFSLPTNKGAKRPASFPADLVIHSIDWAEVARDREGWVKRWDREMSI